MDNGGSSETNQTSSKEDVVDEISDRPHIKSVNVPESIKRRIPSKHYVSFVFS